MEDNESIWEQEPIFSYTREQAINDGVLIEVGKIGGIGIAFTSNLFYHGYEDNEKREQLVKQGIALLKKPDPEDSDRMRLRVIEKDEIWVILDGDGVTFLKPEDY